MDSSVRKATQVEAADTELATSFPLVGGGSSEWTGDEWIGREKVFLKLRFERSSMFGDLCLSMNYGLTVTLMILILSPAVYEAWRYEKNSMSHRCNVPLTSKLIGSDRLGSKHGPDI